ncbi:MAG: hypothetical protein DCF19_06470 [Pseudanabaena frigida]|uniref:Uncharacterized protein n=1 Tax=Pseudanabaena frigida TaxID=945775 RepID=A0A2W4WHM4_9CYAN|nr:MAG: hypothetical protein DCF19_06470 [Pseudanabaena frigida]
MATPDWLAIVDDQITLHLSPTALKQIEQDSVFFADRQDSDDDIIYKLNSQELLQVLASSVGLTTLSQGAIIIWTYYTETNKNGNIGNSPNVRKSPILRTLININGNLSQKVSRDILKHPLGDRILKAHSFIVGQISRQFTTVIAEHIETKLRPFTIAVISMVTVFAWCEPLRKLGEKLHLPNAVIGNCWSIIIAAPITVLAIWWINSKLSFKLSSLPLFRGSFDRKFFQKLGKVLLTFLESRGLRIVAIAIIVVMLLGWLVSKVATNFAHFPIDGQLNRIIRTLESYAEPYLPIAIVSLRKLIVNNLGKIFLRNSFFVKLIFGRFIR